MPLAFDLISTLVIGVTLPVATTLLARSPCSTLASLVGSILVPPRVAATATITNAKTATETIEMMIQRFFFFFPLPFATAASQTGQNSVLIVGTCGARILFRGTTGNRTRLVPAIGLDRLGREFGSRICLL